VKLHSKFVWERFGSPEPVEGQPRLKSIEFLYSTFDAYSPPEEDSFVSLLIRLAVFLARGGARLKRCHADRCRKPEAAVHKAPGEPQALMTIPDLWTGFPNHDPLTVKFKY